MERSVFNVYVCSNWECNAAVHFIWMKTKPSFVIMLTFNLTLTHSYIPSDPSNQTCTTSQILIQCYIPTNERGKGREKTNSKQSNKNTWNSKINRFCFSWKKFMSNNNNDGDDVQCDVITNRCFFRFAPCFMLICLLLCIDTRLQFKLYIFFFINYFLISYNSRRQCSHM